MKAAIAFLLYFMSFSPAQASGPGVETSKFDVAVNRSLQQLQSEVRLLAARCETSERVVCLYRAKALNVTVEGAKRSQTSDAITIVSGYSQGAEGAVKVALEDVISTLAATMIVVDSGTRPMKRQEIVASIGEAIRMRSVAHIDSMNVHYAMAMDDVSSELRILVMRTDAAHP